MTAIAADFLHTEREAKRIARDDGWIDWIRSDADLIAARRGMRFDESRADRVRDFFSRFLKFSDGQFAGKPFDLLPWQYDDLIAPMFGWVKPDGTRRVNRVYCEVPKKNGKSGLGSGLALYLLVGDGESAAKVYSVASDRDQAKIVFDEAVNMVDRSPELSSVLTVNRTVNTIFFREAMSAYKAVSSDAGKKEGLKASGTVFDELHTQKTRVLWDAMRFAGATRRQPMSFAITTAGYDKNSVCWEQHEYTDKVNAGLIDDTAFMGVIYAADESDDWTDPDVWYKANPSLGVTITEESFAADCLEAQNSPAIENSFKRYRLNIWTRQDVRWLSMDRWKACGTAVDSDDLRGEPCWIGLDLASTTDIAACVAVFPGDDGMYDVLCRFYIPGDPSQRETRNQHIYDQWCRDGHMIATPGDCIDFERIRADLNEWGQVFDIQEIAIDRWNGVHMATLLGEYDGFNVVLFGQGFSSMSGPAKKVEELVLSEKIAHGDHPVLNWMAGNVAVEQDHAGNIKPSKKASTEKIDGMVALTMAVGRAMVRDDSGSVYDARGGEIWTT